MGLSGGDIATALVITALAFAVDALDFDCREREDGFYADPKECSKFHRCAGQRAYAYSCGPGLHFNVNGSACDWPEMAGCQSNQDIATGQSTGTDTDTGSSDFTPSCFKKPDGSRFRDPEDCTTYYTCSSGRLFTQKCYFGLLFNNEKGICDYSQNVDCDVKLAVNTDPKSCKSKAEGYTYRDSETCSTYYVCVHGKPVTKSCPARTAFDVELKTCNFINKVDCTESTATTTSAEPFAKARITTTGPPGQTDGPPGQTDGPSDDVTTVAPDVDVTEAAPGSEGGVTTTTTTTTRKPWTKPTTRKPVAGEKRACLRRVCYYTNWSQYRPGLGKFWPEDIDPFACTHIIFAFAKVDGGKLLNVEWNDRTGWQPGLYARINKLKEQNPELKTLLAVGGWNHPWEKFSAICKTRKSRRLFVDTTIPYLNESGFDGLDLDWEYPGNRGSPAEDKYRFTELVKDLRRGFDAYAREMGVAPLLLTAAVAAGRSTITAAYEIEKISKDLDFVNLMSYDLHGSWDKKTGHNAPLDGPSGDTLTVKAAVEYWVSNGCPKSKLVVGLATYGHTFTLSGTDSSVGAPTSGPGRSGTFTREAGFLAYYEICAIDAERTVLWDRVGKVPYMTVGNQWISYDNTRSLEEKVRYIRDEGLGGAMNWAIDMDDFKETCKNGAYPLWSAVITACNA